MTLTAPEWLARRGGGLKLGSDGRTWFVFLDDQPLYSLVAVPAEGKHGCVIRQTRNGQRVPSGQIAATAADAIAAGLDDLGKNLGWN